MIKQVLKRIITPMLPQLYYDYKAFITTYYENSDFFDYIFKRFFYRFKKGDYYVKDRNSVIAGNILVGKNSKIAQRGGCYIQGIGKLFIGDYVNVTQNCIIISGNHDIYNHDKHIKKETIIGDQCWIGSNSCIMAGVVLGPRTIVGAGSVVTKSFPEGYCIVAGNPAKIVKTLNPAEYVPRKYDIEHYGYIRADKFPEYKKKYLGHLKFEYDLSKVTLNKELINETRR